MKLNRLFDLLEEIQDKAAVEAVFGPPTQVGEKTIIPIGRVTYGFGLGFGQDIGSTAPLAESSESSEDDVARSGSEGGGAGGGLSVQPLAVLEVTPETTTLKPVEDQGRIAKLVTLVIAWNVFWLARALTKIFGKK